MITPNLDVIQTLEDKNAAVMNGAILLVECLKPQDRTNMEGVGVYEQNGENPFLILSYSSKKPTIFHWVLFDIVHENVAKKGGVEKAFTTYLFLDDGSDKEFLQIGTPLPLLTNLTGNVFGLETQNQRLDDDQNEKGNKNDDSLFSVDSQKKSFNPLIF